MPLIVAIEPDGRQAAQLVALTRGQLRVKLVVAESTERAIAVIDEQIPDLIPPPALLSPKDEDALADRLRALNDAAAHVQTLTIPMFATATRTRDKKGMLSRLRRPRKSASAPDGCDPKVFAEQIAQYLERAEAERALIEAAAADKLANQSEAASEATESVATFGPQVDDSPGAMESPAGDQQAIDRLIDALLVAPVPIEPATAVVDPPVVLVAPNAMDAGGSAAADFAPMPPYHDVQTD